MAYDFSEEAKMTNEKLADELSKLTPLKADELNKLLPRKIDKKRLNDILQIVNSSASQNKQLASLKNNIEDLGGVVLKVFIEIFIIEISINIWSVYFPFINFKQRGKKCMKKYYIL